MPYNDNDPYRDQHGQFHEPTFSQMAGMATKGMIIAKVAGADISWRQAFAPMIFYLSFFFWAGVIFLIMFIFVLANTPRDKYTPEQVKQTQQKEQSERDVLALRCRMDNQNSYNLLVNESRRTGIPMPSFHPKLC